MEFAEAFRIALQSLWANKLRTVLTLLGVVIGVASVILVVTLVNGANVFVATKINNVGADTFTISQSPSIVTNFADHVKYSKRKIITMDQFRALETECTRCTGIGAQQATVGKIVVGTHSSTDTSIRGYTWQMPDLQNLNIITGRGLTEADDEHASHVAVIGTDVRDNLMPGEDPIGKEIRVDGAPYTVVGMSEKQGSTLGQSQDNWVGIPLNAFQRSYGTQKTLLVYAKAGTGAARLEAATDQARQIMRALRHDRPGEDDSFTVETSDSLTGLWTQISGNFEAVAVALSGVALVVGGIVIMNIMLVSVTERTREIGVRKALGARRGDILLQFLMESATMSLVGGAIGVLLGAGAAQGVTLALGFPSAIAVWSIFAGLFVATAVGIFFGVYPARKAAMLDPIVALRSDF